MYLYFTDGRISMAVAEEGDFTRGGSGIGSGECGEMVWDHPGTVLTDHRITEDDFGRVFAEGDPDGQMGLIDVTGVLFLDYLIEGFL